MRIAVNIPCQKEKNVNRSVSEVLYTTA